MSARVRYGKRPRRGIRLPNAVEINILSFLLPECKEEVLLAYRRAFGLCLRVSVWLLRRFPRVGRVEAEILAANWPLEVPRGDATDGLSGEWNFTMDLLGVLGDLNAAALIETETPDFGERPDEYWDEWVWTELRPDHFRPDDDNEEYCKALAEVLGAFARASSGSASLKRAGAACSLRLPVLGRVCRRPPVVPLSSFRVRKDSSATGRPRQGGQGGDFEHGKALLPIGVAKNGRAVDGKKGQAEEGLYRIFGKGVEMWKNQSGEKAEM
jgi:hypothetical protein